MTIPIIQAQELDKHYGKHQALKNINLSIEPGCILGLVGHNGAGKSTLLKAILGLTSYHGDLNVLGQNPREHRVSLLNDIAYIADTATLPRWMKVSQAIDYVDGVHSKFDKSLAFNILDKTTIKLNSKISSLSKGMVTQLHLALVMSIDAKLLILDEPTLGLDIIYRKHFYQSLLDEFYDGDKTIIIATHQIEEVESILTHSAFIKNGEIILFETMEALQSQFTEVSLKDSDVQQGLDLKPIAQRKELGGRRMLFKDVPSQQLASLGSTHIPSLSDIFVALNKPYGEV